MDIKQIEEFQRILFDEHPDGIYLLSITGVFIDGNHAAERISGYSKEELIGKNFATANILPIQQIPRAGILIAQTIAGIETDSQEFTIIRKDKSKLEVELRSRKIMLNGQWFILGSVRDISFRKKAEKQIKLSEEKYSSIFNNAADGILYLNRKGKVLDSNPMVSEMLGLSSEELIGHNIVALARKFITTRELPRILKSMGKMLKGETIDEFLLEYNNRYLEINITAERKTKGITAVFRDITDRVKAINELKESEVKFRAIVENAQPIIFVLDKEGKFLLSEGKSLSRLKLEPGQVVGMSAYDLYKDFPVIIRMIKDALQGKVDKGLLEMGFADFDIFMSPYKDAHGSIIGVIGMAVDITEMKQTEKALIESKERAEESDYLKSAFIANISHEIRTPLNSILGFSELLSDYEIDRDQCKKYYDLIKAGGKQLISIIDNLLDISIIESGKLKLNIETVNLKELLCSFKEQFNVSHPESTEKLIIEDYPEAFVKTDKSRLIQILNNLVGNAIKYSNFQDVQLSCSCSEEVVEFCITDLGEGIPEEMKDKIFDRFFRITNPHKIAKGSGLGLSITKAIVEAMGGEIWFEPNKSVGTKFYFTIPT